MLNASAFITCVGSKKCQNFWCNTYTIHTCVHWCRNVECSYKNARCHKMTIIWCNRTTTPPFNNKVTTEKFKSEQMSERTNAARITHACIYSMRWIKCYLLKATITSLSGHQYIWSKVQSVHKYILFKNASTVFDLPRKENSEMSIYKQRSVFLIRLVCQNSRFWTFLRPNQYLNLDYVYCKIRWYNRKTIVFMRILHFGSIKLMPG